MNEKILISIVIPAFKAQYLHEAIASCLAQTYSNFELIVVNDCSPENLEMIVTNFEDSRIRYYCNAANCGALNVVDNWNICLGYCKGDYVICMGDDDRLKPCCLEEYIKLIEKYPGLGVYHAWTELIDEKSNYFDIQEPRPEYENVYSLLWNRWMVRDKQYIGDFLFDVANLRRNGGFFKLPLAWASDDISAVIAAAKGGIANTQAICFQYRVNPYSITNSGNFDIKVDSIVQERAWYENFLVSRLPQNAMEQKYYDVILRSKDRFFDRKIGLYLGLGIRQRWSLFFKFWRKRKELKLNNFVFKYALFVAVKTRKDIC